MKKLVFLFAVCAAMTITSCGNKCDNTEECDSLGTTVVDSLDIDTLADAGTTTVSIRSLFD